MSRENRRQAVYRMAAVALLREMHPTITDSAQQSFMVRIESTCVLCGEELAYGDTGKWVNWHRTDAVAPVQLPAHYDCPSPETRIRRLFEVDGDVIMRELPSAQTGVCFRCKGPLQGTRAVQVLTRDLWFRTIHWDCRQTSGPTE